MEQRLENSTLIALRELRSYEKERQLSERRKQEEEARQARERKERRRLAEEAAREQALENQLRTDLQHAEKEIRLLKQEANRRGCEANQALQALRALASVPQTTTSPGVAPPTRHGRWLAALGGTALLASALVLVIGLRHNPAMPALRPPQAPSGPASVKSTLSPTPASAEPAHTVPTLRPAGSVSVEGGGQHPPSSHPRKPAIQHPLRKPRPAKPACDGTDPLCGLPINSSAP